MNPRSVALVLLCTISFVNPASIPGSNPKHVILIIGDDLGWHDVGFHGSEIPTPNIDALASTGTILKNYYVGPTCSPSRTEMMTGRYAMRTGINDPIPIQMPYGLGLDEKLLPQYLKDAGYATHLVGKWHLGHHHKAYTPTFRGFDTHYGYVGGFTDYWDHTTRGGLDFMDSDAHSETPVRNETFVYRTDLYTKRVIKIIKQHKETQGEKRLYLQIAHQAPHFGEEFAPQQAPKKYVDAVSNIKPLTRKLYAAMVVSLDHSIGEMLLALNEANMLNDSLIIFTADNGGAASGMFLSHASNWPFRGSKGSMWEGGVRSTGFIWHPTSLPNLGTVSDVMMHGTDLLPTILAAVKVTATDRKIDGINQWAVLTNTTQEKRSSILHGLSYKMYGYRKGDFKLVWGKTKLTEWDQCYSPTSIWEKGILKLLEHYGLYLISSPTKRETILDGFKKGSGSGEGIWDSSDFSNIQNTTNDVKTVLRDLVGQFSNVVVNMSCPVSNKVHISPECKYGEKTCLFNVANDPCESYNIAADDPDKYAELLNDIVKFKKEAVPSRFKWGNLKVFPKEWVPWVEDESAPPPQQDTPQCPKSAAYRIVPTTYTLITVFAVFSYVLM